MYGQSNARDVLLLAAEDAFEFERWRDAGPVTADIDPEVAAAEIAEFEALGIPMPAELDSLRRELEHAPKVREAIRHSSLALRRHGRASASALVALQPQQLLPMQPGALPWGLPMLDPRLAAAAMDPRIAARLAGPGLLEAHEPRRKPSSRVAAAAEIAGARGQAGSESDAEFGPPRVRSRNSDPVEVELVDDEFDDDEFDDDEFDESPPSKARARQRGAKRRAQSKRARAARPRDDWDDDDDDDEFESVVARPGSDPRTTWILAGISAAALISLLWVAVAQTRKDDGEGAAALAAQPQQPLQEAAPQQPAPPLAAEGGVDPAAEVGQAPAAVPTSAPASGIARRSTGASAMRSSTSGTSTGGGLNPFATYKTPDDPGTPNSGVATQPAVEGSTPAAPGGAAPATAGSKDPSATAAEGEPAPTPTPAPTDEAKPAEEPKPETPQLTKSKMTPAIRTAVVAKVGDLQACYHDAMAGKPDLAGQVVFTISLDQDGVVKKVEVAKDEVQYGVAKCAAKKIQRWTLPSAGIPIIFDLPFDFQS